MGSIGVIGSNGSSGSSGSIGSIGWHGTPVGGTLGLRRTSELMDKTTKQKQKTTKRIMELYLIGLFVGLFGFSMKSLVRLKGLRLLHYDRIIIGSNYFLTTF